MANKDFRSRLKQQKTELNPAAWNQMEDMLNGIPMEVPEKEKSSFDRRWLLLIFLLFSSGALVMWSYSGTDKIKNELLGETVKEQSEEKKSLSTLSGSENLSENNRELQIRNSNEIVKGKSARINSPEIKSGYSTNERKDLEGTSDVNRDGLQSDLNIAENDLELKGKNKNKESFLETVNKDYSTQNRSDVSGDINLSYLDLNKKEESGLKKDVVITNYKIDSPLSSNESSKLNSNKQIDSKAAAENTSTNNSSKEKAATEKDGNSVEQRSGIGLVERLDRDILLLSIVNKSLPPLTPDVIIPRRRNLFLSINAGAANFNANKNGFHFGLGLYRELNKLIGVEIGSWYTRGLIRSAILNKTVEQESQIDIGFLLHLNMVKNDNHKVSLELGRAYTFYRSYKFLGSTEESKIENNFNGFSYQLGFSYLYNYSSNSAIGIKLGSTLFNDAAGFLAVKSVHQF